MAGRKQAELSQVGRKKVGGGPLPAAALDQMSALEIARAMNREDETVARAVRRALPAIGRAIDLIRERLERGGRLIYVGSGTSGRIGALDAAECPPTFGTDPAMVQAVIAGGERALARAVEGSEDSSKLAKADLSATRPGKKDVVVGLSASGQTTYTITALRYARDKGATTIAVVCRKGSELACVGDLAIEVPTGAEVVSGSTRLKAGTAQKMICNMLTTGAMARLGYIYDGQMVNVQMNNAKLVERGISIVQRLGGVERDRAEGALESAGWKVPVALIMLRLGVSRTEAERRLKRAGGNVRTAFEAAAAQSSSSRRENRAKF